MSSSDIASRITHGGFDVKAAVKAINNWRKGLYKPKPTADDVERLADALSVEVAEISEWRASYKYAPSSPTKARLVTALISGRSTQDALDVLKFEHKRAARMIEKVLQTAIAAADESAADVDNLYISESRVDGAGRRIGTKTWIAKDRGRAHPIKKQACHIHIAVSEE
ncbi:MAG: 50S ribosomal protein L22 [Planctomycetes bacterium]|nr:50S ribosomal protein L22 [Planctomycetota bacterium]